MAVSRTMRQFGIRMSLVADRFTGNASKVVRRAALAADQAIVQGTPVDSGRARANWVASVGAPVEQPTEEVDPSGQSAIAQASGVISGYTVGAGGIFLTNALPYIQGLEDGNSAQAPGGMTKFGLQAARRELRKGGLLDDL